MDALRNTSSELPDVSVQSPAPRHLTLSPHENIKSNDLRKLAVTHHQACRFDQAVQAYKLLLQHHPHDTSLWTNLGVAFRQQKHYQAAINCYTRALSIQPDDLAAKGNLANALKDVHRLDESIALHQQVVAAKPNDVQSLMNYACALRENRQFEQALEQLDKAQAIDPKNAGVEWERSQNLLHLGRYAEGWKAYEARWYTGDLPQKTFTCPSLIDEVLLPSSSFPRRRESSSFINSSDGLLGKTILLHTEQGYGDTILAARYIPLLKAQVGEAGAIILQCKPELHRLFKTVGADLLITPEQSPGDEMTNRHSGEGQNPEMARHSGEGRNPDNTCHSEQSEESLHTSETTIPIPDYHCPLMSLPGFFDTQPDTIPPPATLHIPDESRQKFAAIINQGVIPAKAGQTCSTFDRRRRPEGRAQRVIHKHLEESQNKILSIGIVWSGSVTFKNNHNRALSLKDFLPLAEHPDIRLFSLQKGPPQKELYESGADTFITDIGKLCEDFADTAAAIEQLDAIVMTDSSVAHLASTLGKPVINILNRVPYWLYTLEKDHSPWYPGMQFIYRDEVHDWREEVIQALRHSREYGDTSVGAGHARESGNPETSSLDSDCLSRHSGEGRNLETTTRHLEQSNTVIPMSPAVIPAKAGIHNDLDIPTFVINLNRRADRWQHFQQWNDTAHINIERLDAIDGQQLNDDALQQLIAQKLLHPDAINSKPAEIACALSHRNAWLKAIELNQPIIVLEDDVVLRNDFQQQLPAVMNQLPTDWDIVLLGYNLDSILDLQITQGLHSISRYIAFDEITKTWQRPTSLNQQMNTFKQEAAAPTVVKLNNAFGACAYVISPVAAKKLIGAIFPLKLVAAQIPALGKTLGSLAIDIQLNRQYRSCNSYAVIQPLALAVNDKESSDIQGIKL